MVFVVEQSVAVRHHTGRRVVAGDGDGIAQWRGAALREAIDHTATDDADTADGQALQAVRGGYGETAGLGQGR
ncbi:hypothetical protein D3C76_981940 [compost metagenome]